MQQVCVVVWRLQFSSPFLTAMTNQMMLGSNHSWFILMAAFVPIDEAVVVKSDQRMNSGGTPIAFEWALTKSLLKNSVEMEKEQMAWAFL